MLLPEAFDSDVEDFVADVFFFNTEVVVGVVASPSLALSIAFFSVRFLELLGHLIFSEALV